MSRLRGFTAVELLVSLSVATLLTVNSIPALAKAREAAHRSQCKFNLKQIGLAIYNYHDTFDTVPPGFVVKDWNSPTARGFGWNAQLLPYLDHAPLYNLIDWKGLDNSLEKPEIRKVLLAQLSEFRCPSDLLPEFNAYRGGWPTSNYSGNAGSWPFPRLSTGSMTDYWPGRIPTVRTIGIPGKPSYNPKNQRTNGVFAVNSMIRFSNITDGLSNTMIAAERGASSLGGIWLGVTAASHENDVITECSHLSRPNRSNTAFSSQHDGGLHILMGDGSVRFLNEEVESKPGLDPTQGGVWQKLASRNDGQEVGEF